MRSIAAALACALIAATPALAQDKMAESNKIADALGPLILPCMNKALSPEEKLAACTTAADAIEAARRKVPHRPVWQDNLFDFLMVSAIGGQSSAMVKIDNARSQRACTAAERSYVYLRRLQPDQAAPAYGTFYRQIMANPSGVRACRTDFGKPAGAPD